MIFHWLAVVTLGAYLAFMFVTWFGSRLGIIEPMMISWDEQPFVSKAQLFHMWFGMAATALILFTFIFAPVAWFIWLPSMALFCIRHISLKGIHLPAPWNKIAKWVGFFVELIYLIALVFLI